MRKKISTTIYVTPEQSDKLKLLHERTKVPVAVYIREGIDLVLRHYAHMLPGQLPLVDSAPLLETRESRESREAPPARESSSGRRESRDPRAERDSRQDVSQLDDKASAKVDRPR